MTAELPRLPFGFETWPNSAQAVYRAMTVTFSRHDRPGQTGTLLTLKYQSADARDQSNTSSLHAAFFLSEHPKPELKVLAIEADPLLRRRALYPLAVQRAVQAAIQYQPEAFRGPDGGLTGDLVGTVVSESTLKLRQLISKETTIRESDSGFPVAITPLSSLVGTPAKTPLISNLSRLAREGNLYSDLREGLFHDELDAFQKITKALRPTLLDPAITDTRPVTQSLFSRKPGETELSYARRFLHPEIRQVLGTAATYATLDHLGRAAGLPVTAEDLAARLMRLNRTPTPDESMSIMLVENALMKAENAPHDPKARFEAYLEVANQFEQPALRDLFGLPARPPIAPQDPPAPGYRTIGLSPSPVAVLTDPDKFESVGQVLADRNARSGGRTAYVLVDAANSEEIRKAISETRPTSVVYLTQNPAANRELVAALSTLAQSHGLPFLTNQSPSPVLAPTGPAQPSRSEREV